MKKLLVVLLALTVVGVFAFADDAAAPAPAAPVTTATPALKITGSVDSGVELAKGSTTDLLRGYDLWNSGDQTRATVNLSYTSGDFVYTVEAVTNSGSFSAINYNLAATTTTPAVSTTTGFSYAQGTSGNAMMPVLLDVASAKGSFFGGLLTAEVGMSNNGDFGCSGDNGANYFGQGGYNENGVNGLVLTLTPVTGLEFGYGLPVVNVSSGNVSTIENNAAYSRYAVAYTMPKMFKLVAAYDGSYIANSAALDASLSVSAVDNLSLVLEAYLVDIGAPNTNASAYDLWDVGASYTIGAIQPGVQFDYYTYTLSSATSQWEVRPYVNYTMDKTTISAAFKLISTPDTVKGSPTTALTTSASTYYNVDLTVKQAFTPAIWGELGVSYATDGGNGFDGMNGNGANFNDPAFIVAASMNVSF
jgi:hypothetical protein